MRARPKGFGLSMMPAQPTAAASPPAPAPAREVNSIVEGGCDPAIAEELQSRGFTFVFDDGGKRVEVGRGAFGVAYLAKDKNDTEVVVKEIDLNNKKLSPRDRMKAHLEVEFLQGFTHPFVVKCLDSFNTYKTLNIVMEYASNGTLNGCIEAAKKDGAPFRAAKVIKWYAEIVSALDHLHSARVLHRDLKPANVFLDKDMRVKLGDFGMSRKLDDEDNLSGGQVGTPFYFGPEICQKRPYSNKTDIWCSGVVLFEMACLSRPFDAKSLKSLFRVIQEAKHAPIPATVDPRIVAWIKRILVVPQKDRPNASKLCQDPDLVEYVHKEVKPPPVLSCSLSESDAKSKAVSRWCMNVGSLSEEEMAKEKEKEMLALAEREKIGRSASASPEGEYEDDFEDEDAYEDDFFEEDEDADVGSFDDYNYD